MEYNKMVKKEETACEIKTVNEAPLSAIMDEACAKANDALHIAQKINMHLFGGVPTEGKNANPSCFMEALQNHNCTLTMLLEELSIMAERLGV